MDTSSSAAATITRKTIPDNQRINHTAKLFGHNFPMRLEPFIYSITGSIASEYHGGYWGFYELSNGGFYMAPAVAVALANSDSQFHVCCENGFEGELSADALGIIACLYAYSNLSFSGIKGFAETCAQHYHLLREYMFEHSEVGNILHAID